MRVGFDLDGTSWKYREFFSTIAIGLKLVNVEIGIVTIHKGLKNPDLKLWLSRGFPPADFYFSKDEYPVDLDVRSWKIMVCKENDIHYLFDDFESDEIKLMGIE